MIKKSNQVICCISAKCNIDELKILLKTYQINYFNENVINKKFYFDQIDYFIFETNLSRKDIFAKIDIALGLKENINEIIFLNCDEYYKFLKNNYNN